MLKTTIPFVDLRDKTPTDLLRSYPDKAQALLSAARWWWGTGLVLPVSDRKSMAWLRRTKNPYLHEIEAAADILGGSGISTLNLSYEWACTSGAYLLAGQVHLLRLLDWPLKGIGRHIVVAHQKGEAGEFYNVTWPGLSGIFQAMAPGRFAASINLAPMRRHGLGLAGDWVYNRFIAAKATGLPPAHLLRQAFERAKNYAEAKEMLVATPLATPAIFTLAGLAPGQGCIIERLENAAEIKELSAAQIVSAANDFHSGFVTRPKGWRPRMLDNEGRFRQSLEISMQELQLGNFSWLRPPMLNRFTRLVMQANAAAGALTVQGYEGQGEVTNLFAVQPVTG